jgi:hypothetical protein
MTTLTQSITKEITWDHIAEVCRNGEAKEFFNVGDVISITLKNNEKMRIAVAGIETYAENEVIFAFKDILAKEQPMNKECTNKGGYDGSDMATYLDTEIFDLLPDDLQEVIKERRGHKLWLFSRREVFGEDGNYICPEDDVQLPYYKDIENRVKTRQGDTDWWWLASPSAARTADFAFVGSYGNARSNYASYSIGVAPGFCI